MHPAAGALGALGFGDTHGELGEVDTLSHFSTLLGGRPVAGGDDTHLGQVHALTGLLQLLAGGLQGDMGLQGLADALVGTGLFQNAVDILAELHDGVPAGHGLGGQGIGFEALGHLVQQHIAAVIGIPVRHVLPDLVTGEGQNGGEELGHGVQDQEQGSLGGAAAQAVLLLAVQPVLQNVQIEAGQVHHAEVVDGVGDHVVFVAHVGLAAGLYQLVQAGQGPAVQLLQLLGGDQAVGIEFVQVAQAIPGGVAELQVVLGDLLKDLFGAAHIGMVVGGGGPQADDIRAELLDQVGGVYAVAQGLVHGTALAVYGPAVGQNLTEGSTLVQSADGGQKGGLEPAAVLVGTLQIHVGGPQLRGPVHQRGIVGGAGVEPAVQGVLLLGEVLAAAVGAGEALRGQLHGILLEPDVGAVFIKELGELGDGLGGGHRLAAVLAVEHGDGQTPAALTGDAPIRPFPDHAGHPVLAPGGIPLDVLDGLDGLILEGLYGAEPLRSGPEDDRLLAAVVMGVRVDDVLGGEQSAGLTHVLQDDRVRFLRLHTGVLAGVVGVPTVVVYGDHQLHAVAHAGLIVIGAEAGGGVNTARTGIHGDILSVDQPGGFVHEGMLGQHILKEGAGVAGQDLVVLEAADVHDLVHQGLGHDVGVPIVRLDENIAVPGVEADSQVAGQGPDGGGPDHEVGVGQVKLAELAQIVLHGELDVNGGDGIVLVLDVGLGHGGNAVGAPGHGLQALVDVALVEHPAKNLDLLGLKVLVHGAVGMLPVANHAQTLKAAHLLLDEVLGEGLTGFPELGDGQVLVELLLGGLDGPLNGQAVVVPAGDVGGIVAHHGVGTDDEVLQGLIQGVAHVDIAVGEGRAVVKHKPGQILVLLQHGLVQVHFFPAFQHARLPGGEAGLHGEVGFWGDDGVFIIHWKVTSI